MAGRLLPLLRNSTSRNNYLSLHFKDKVFKVLVFTSCFWNFYHILETAELCNRPAEVKKKATKKDIQLNACRIFSLLPLSSPFEAWGSCCNCSEPTNTLCWSSCHSNIIYVDRRSGVKHNRAMDSSIIKEIKPDVLYKIVLGIPEWARQEKWPHYVSLHKNWRQHTDASNVLVK